MCSLECFFPTSHNAHILHDNNSEACTCRCFVTMTSLFKFYSYWCRDNKVTSNGKVARFLRVETVYTYSRQ